MCNCNSKKNQTPKEAFSILEKSKDLELPGIGLFLIPAPEKGIYEFKKIIVPDISLSETAKRGLNCEAFKFIPYGMEFETTKGKFQINSIKDIEEFYCFEYACVGTNPYCPSPCFCSYLNGCV
jgi:hypothetical protein